MVDKVIKIVDIEEKILDLYKFSPDDLETFVERLTEANDISMHFDEFHLDSMKYMIQKEIDYNKILLLPNIIELLLIKIIQIGQYYLKKLNDSIEPLKTFLILPMCVKKNKENRDNKNIFKLRFDNPIYFIAMDNNKQIQVAYTNEEVFVIGFRIIKMLLKKFLHSINSYI